MTNPINIEEYLKAEFGIDQNTISKQLVETAVAKLSEASNVKNERELLELLIRNPSIRQKLFEEIKVTETWFFRSEPTFEYLEKLIKSKRAKRQLPINILSVPSSSGEEPYSIAMILDKLGITSAECTVDAVDMSADIIQLAKQGIYTKNAFRSKMIEEYKNRFVEEETNRFVLDDAIKKRVSFTTANLNNGIARKLNKKYDFIFCRNVLIYFTEEAKLASVNEIKKMIKDDGVLFAGFSESLLFLSNGFVKTGDSMSFALVLDTAAGANNTNTSAEKKARPVYQNLGSSTATPMQPIRRIQPLIKPLGQMKTAHSQADHYTEIKVLADRGRLQNAVDYIESINMEKVTDANVHFICGVVYMALKQEVKAIDYYEKALYLDANHEEVMMHLIVAYRDSGREYKAGMLERRLNRLK